MHNKVIHSRTKIIRANHSIKLTSLSILIRTPWMLRIVHISWRLIDILISLWWTQFISLNRLSILFRWISLRLFLGEVRIVLISKQISLRPFNREIAWCSLKTTTKETCKVVQESTHQLSTATSKQSHQVEQIKLQLALSIPKRTRKRLTTNSSKKANLSTQPTSENKIKATFWRKTSVFRKGNTSHQSMFQFWFRSTKSR